MFWFFVYLYLHSLKHCVSRGHCSVGTTARKCARHRAAATSIPRHKARALLCGCNVSTMTHSESSTGQLPHLCHDTKREQHWAVATFIPRHKARAALGSCHIYTTTQSESTTGQLQSLYQDRKEAYHCAGGTVGLQNSNHLLPIFFTPASLRL